MPLDNSLMNQSLNTNVDVALILGDIAYLSSFLLIIITILWNKTCAGWSGRMHILIVFIHVARYWDMLNTNGTIYQITMKSLWILLPLIILYLIYVKFKDTYEKTNDTFWIEIIILPSAAAAFIFCSDVYSPAEFLWLFSRFVESQSILPQFYLIFHSGKKTFFVTVYVVILIYYRLFYFAHWMADYYIFGEVNSFALFPGIIQIVLYALYFLIPQGKNLPPDEIEPEPVERRNIPRYLTQESLLETPLLKRSATSSSSIYLIGCESNCSTLNRSTYSSGAGSSNEEGRY